MENNTRIPRSEILKLYESCSEDLTAYELGRWLRTVTDGKNLVIPQVAIKGLYNMANEFECTAEVALAEAQGIKEGILDEWLND